MSASATAPEAAAASSAPAVPPAPAHATHDGEPAQSHKYIIAFAVVLASLLQVIDSSIVNVALPDMMGNLGASLDEIAWVSTGYILASVVVMPLTGWLGGMFGRKRYFVGSIVIFTASSFFCGAAHSLALLIFWRVVQGVGGGALMTVSQAVLLETFPPEEAGMAMALFGLGVMVGPTIGPTLGGWITDNYSWPWIFYINVPLGIVAAFMIGTYVHDSKHQKRAASVDYTGIGLLIVCVSSLQYLFEYGQRDDWFASKLMIALAIIAGIGGVALAWRELTTDHPVIDFRVLRHRPMWVGTVLGIVMGVGLYASVFTLPVFMQNNLRMTAEQTGIVLLPGALATAVSMWVVGRLTAKFDGRLLIAIGAATFALAMWQLSEITGDSGSGDFVVPLILRGIGLGLMFVPLTTLTLADLPRRELPQATGLYNFFRQLGGSLGIAGVATIVSHDTVQAKAVLAAHITTTDPGSLGRVNMLARGFAARGADAGTAMHRAYAVIDREIFGQASVIAYSHSYIIAALLVLALIPLLVLVRQSKSASSAEMMLE